MVTFDLYAFLLLPLSLSHLPMSQYEMIAALADLICCVVIVGQKHDTW